MFSGAGESEIERWEPGQIPGPAWRCGNLQALTKEPINKQNKQPSEHFVRYYYCWNFRLRKSRSTWWMVHIACSAWPRVLTPLFNRSTNKWCRSDHTLLVYCLVLKYSVKNILKLTHSRHPINVAIINGLCGSWLQCVSFIQMCKYLRTLTNVQVYYFVLTLQELDLPQDCSHIFTIWICSRNLRESPSTFFLMLKRFIFLVLWGSGNLNYSKENIKFSSEIMCG